MWVISEGKEKREREKRERIKGEGVKMRMYDLCESTVRQGSVRRTPVTCCQRRLPVSLF